MSTYKIIAIVFTVLAVDWTICITIATLYFGYHYYDFKRTLYGLTGAYIAALGVCGMYEALCMMYENSSVVEPILTSSEFSNVSESLSERLKIEELDSTNHMSEEERELEEHRRKWKRNLLIGFLIYYALCNM